MIPCSHWNGTLETKSECANKKAVRQNLVVSVFSRPPLICLEEFPTESSIIYIECSTWRELPAGTDRSPLREWYSFIFVREVIHNLKTLKLKLVFFDCPPPPKIVQWTGLYKPIHGEWHAIYFGLQNIAPSTRRDVELTSRPAACRVSRVSGESFIRHDLPNYSHYPHQKKAGFNSRPY